MKTGVRSHAFTLAYDRYFYMIYRNIKIYAEDPPRRIMPHKNSKGPPPTDGGPFDSDISFYCIVCLFNGERGCHNNVYLVAVGKLIQRMEQALKSLAVIVAYAQCGINKYVGYIVIACKNTRNKAVKCTRIKHIILVNINKTALVADIIAQLYALFDANDRTLAGCDCFVHHLDECFGLAGALDSNK